MTIQERWWKLLSTTSQRLTEQTLERLLVGRRGQRSKTKVQVRVRLPTVHFPVLSAGKWWHQNPPILDSVVLTRPLCHRRLSIDLGLAIKFGS